jgi:hypothetical protein
MATRKLYKKGGRKNGKSYRKSKNGKKCYKNKTRKLKNMRGGYLFKGWKKLAGETFGFKEKTNVLPYHVQIANVFENKSDNTLPSYNIPDVDDDLHNLSNVEFTKENNNNFLTSNLEKFLLWFKQNYPVETNVKVIAHSNTMQKFMEKFNFEKRKATIGTAYKKYKFRGISTFEDEILKENVWSIFLNENILITRHANSVANYLQKNLSVSYKDVTKYSTEQDTNLTLYGIFSALIQGELLNNTVNMPNQNEQNINIFVSVLKRTWETAIMLYLPFFEKSNENENKTITLIVSPFLIEKGANKTEDNFPADLNVQLTHFIDFLNIIYKYSLDGIINDKIKESLTLFKSFFDNRNHIMINYIPNSKSYKIGAYGYKGYNKNISLLQDNELTSDLFQTIPPSQLNITSLTIIKGVCKPSGDVLKHMSEYCEPLSLATIKNPESSKTACDNHLKVFSKPIKPYNCETPLLDKKINEQTNNMTNEQTDNMKIEEIDKPNFMPDTQIEQEQIEQEQIEQEQINNNFMTNEKIEDHNKKYANQLFSIGGTNKSKRNKSKREHKK